VSAQDAIRCDMKRSKSKAKVFSKCKVRSYQTRTRSCMSDRTYVPFEHRMKYLIFCCTSWSACWELEPLLSVPRHTLNSCTCTFLGSLLTSSPARAASYNLLPPTRIAENMGGTCTMEVTLHASPVFQSAVHTAAPLSEPGNVLQHRHDQPTASHTAGINTGARVECEWQRQSSSE
jgi:hypothetical protein